MIICDYCKGEIDVDKGGALLFSPPAVMSAKARPIVEKLHVCRECYEKIKPNINVRFIISEEDMILLKKVLSYYKDKRLDNFHWTDLDEILKRIHENIVKI